MPPVMNRNSSQARCRQGWELRCRGRTWQEVADELDFRSRHSAHKAITKWLAQNPPDDLETMRRASGTMIMSTTRKLDEALDTAIEEGKTRDAAELGKAIFDGVEKYAKLTGQHVVVPKQVDITVTQTLSEMLTETRDRLMAAIETGNIIDAEVVPLPTTTEAQQ